MLIRRGCVRSDVTVCRASAVCLYRRHVRPADHLSAEPAASVAGLVLAAPVAAAPVAVVAEPLAAAVVAALPAALAVVPALAVVEPAAVAAALVAQHAALAVAPGAVEPAVVAEAAVAAAPDALRVLLAALLVARDVRPAVVAPDALHALPAALLVAPDAQLVAVAAPDERHVQPAALVAAAAVVHDRQDVHVPLVVQQQQAGQFRQDVQLQRVVRFQPVAHSPVALLVVHSQLAEHSLPAAHLVLVVHL